MDALTDFFAMGGYALYVWTSYALSLLLIGGVAVYASLQLSRARRETFARALSRDLSRQRGEVQP